jgi:AcrR family transcriptional regulator
MVRGRKKGDHDAKREEIAEAACQVILRLGLAQASMSEIARQMGYTTGILRHYFVDKEELLLFAKNLLFDRSHEKALSAAMRHNGVEKLRAMTMALLPCDQASVDRFRLLATFNGYAIGNAQLMKAQYKRDAEHWRTFEQVISALQEDGSLPRTLNARVEACGIFAMLDGLADQVIMNPGEWAPEELTGLMSRYIDSLGQERDRSDSHVVSRLPPTVARRNARRA